MDLTTSETISTSYNKTVASRAYDEIQRKRFSTDGVVHLKMLFWCFCVFVIIKKEKHSHFLCL